MNVTIIYFSGTGNTWWVADQIKQNLKISTVEMFSVENPKLKDKEFRENLLGRTDHLVLGYPIYASRMPDPIHNFVEELPYFSDSKTISIFCTQAFASGDGASYDHKRFKSRGFNLMQTVHLNMGNNFYIPHLPFFPLKGEEHLKLLNSKALKKIKKLCLDIQNHKRSHVKLNPLGIGIGKLQRAFFNTTIKTVRDDLSVDENNCTKCKKCVNNCPVDNIELSPTGIKFSDKCVACVRCYHFCPESCILLGEKTRDIGKYYRYKGPVELNLKSIQE